MCVIPPLDPRENLSTSFLSCSEAVSIQHLRLQAREEGLHHRIVKAVWSPGGSVATIVATSLEAPCRASVFVFVAILWPLYLKHGETTRNDVMHRKCLNFMHSTSHHGSYGFIAVQPCLAWGARGPEFKSRRPDQLSREL